MTLEPTNRITSTFNKKYVVHLGVVSMIALLLASCAEAPDTKKNAIDNATIHATYDTTYDNTELALTTLSVNATTGTPVFVDLTKLVQNYPEGTPLNFSIDTQPKHGTASSALAKVMYLSDDDYIGKDSFTISAKYNEAMLTPTTVHINVVPNTNIAEGSDVDYELVDE